MSTRLSLEQMILLGAAFFGGERRLVPLLASGHAKIDLFSINNGFSVL